MKGKSPTRRSLLVTAVISLLAAGACSPTAPSELAGSGSAAEVVMSEHQRKAIEDGVITKDEYEVGYRDFVACLKVQGISVVEGPVVNEVHRYSYSGTGSEGDQCHNQYFLAIDAKWQIQQDQSEATSRALGECLKEGGVEPAQDREEIEKQFARLGKTSAECIAEWMGPPP